MASLPDGAVELPRAHLSARVAWHDTDWTGRVCLAPGANHSCAVLKSIKERKNADHEEEDSGTSWDHLTSERVPPCVFERAGFMRPQAYSIPRKHAYVGRTKSHANFAETVQHMPAYSVEALPFRWVMRSDVPEIARTWGIGYDMDLEDAADRHIEWDKNTAWVQDHRNQLALLESFFSSIRQGSLVFVYTKDVPLLEDRQPGARVLLGVGQVAAPVGPPVEWEYSGKVPIRSILWERSVQHSIRPTLDDGFLLPYHQLLASETLDPDALAPLVAVTPPDHFDEFSYVSERVGDDAAIAALMELIRVVDLLPGTVDGPWGAVAAWLSERLADTWDARGAYPGLGSALVAAGLERGAVIAYRVLNSLAEDADDPWPALERAIADAERGAGPAKGLVGRPSRKAWERVIANPERYAVMRLLARFSLTSAQARRLFDVKQRPVSDSDVLNNPYLLYEADRAALDGLSLETVDRSLFPRSATARASLSHDPLPEPVEESADDRRVRAGSVAVLERGAEQGHMLLDEAGMRKRLADLRLEPRCDPTTDQFEIAAEEFGGVLFERGIKGGHGRAWQLERLAKATDVIAGDVAARLEQGPIVADADWRKLIDDAVGQAMPAPSDPDHALEEAAREEKAKALDALAHARIAALVGPAGTGKTTMLKALCAQPSLAGNVLLLAPTGKARVQLSDKVSAPARTLAQFLRKAERWDWERGYFLNPDGMRFGGYRTVIVDEASMLTEEMLAALIEALQEPQRLILCGDHRQLPPIGPGRPFADLVAHLREQVGDGAGRVAELRIGRRQRSTPEAPRGRARDDLAVATLFAADTRAAGADEALARVIAGKSDGTIEIRSWDDHDSLAETVVDALVTDPTLGLARGDGDALKRSLGATKTHKGRPSFDFGSAGMGAERWQLLSPVRSRLGGILELNRLVRTTWRSGDTTLARTEFELPNPMGADQILFDDKVMCISNHERRPRDIRTGKYVDGDVANGEIGMVVGWPKKYERPLGLWVEFSTQPNLQFTFWENDLNGSGERKREVLEIAYAITVHKAQGSQFETTFVVLPNPCPVLSPELLYTALTRHRTRTVLLVQGDPLRLLELADPARSETARRLTCLFRPPDPFVTADGTLLDGSHVHRSANKELMLSKSEVIVANTLRSLGIGYVYEQSLEMPDGSRRKPDFTILRDGLPPVYWEHLGMLDLAGYQADWEAKRAWYGRHNILPWTEGGGEAGTLVWSSEGQDGQGIDSAEIERLAQEVFAL